MIGITAYGAYVPRLRLARKSVAALWQWLAPSVSGLAQGEKAFCNFDEDSVTMAVAAGRDCLFGRSRADLAGLFLGSTTLPFADRLNAGICATALNLPETTATMDCSSTLRAGTSALNAGLAAVKNDAPGDVLVLAADRREAKPASSHEMWFGDGAAALLLGRENVIAAHLGSYTLSCDFVDHYRAADRRFDYHWEERWVRDEGYGKIIPAAVNGLLESIGLKIGQVDKIVYPCVFKSQHAAIGKALGASREQIVDTLHEVCGETGAAHPLLMLVGALETARPGERIVVAGFGQGSEALCFEVTKAIEDAPPRSGLKRSLADKKVTDNYLMYLKFRGLVETEIGIRGEQPSQTALTTLWRNRRMILGLVGGKCTVCGTPQLPPEEVCVNPECGAVGSQEDYEFADRPVTVKTFTADSLSYTASPPAIYGFVQFEGGGRFLADFTDCELADISVGMPAKMSFRRHIVDEDRGFIGYFWKAVPQKPRDI